MLQKLQETMNSQNIHVIMLQLKSITEGIDKIARGVNNPLAVWVSLIMAGGTFILAIATVYMALATFMALKEDRNKLKEEKKGAYKVFIERIKKYLTTTDKIEKLIKKIIDKENEIPDFKDWAKLLASNVSIKETGELPAGITKEDINNITEKESSIDYNIKLLQGYFERKEEYAIFISKSQVFSANVIRKVITLFDYIHQFINNFQENIKQNELIKAKEELFWMKLFCIETIMALIIDGNLQEEIYYNVDQHGSYTYSDLINCCSKFIINMNKDEFIQQNDEANSKLIGRIQNIIKEFNIDISKPIEDLEICKMSE